MGAGYQVDLYNDNKTDVIVLFWYLPYSLLQYSLLQPDRTDVVRGRNRTRNSSGTISSFLGSVVKQ